MTDAASPPSVAAALLRGGVIPAHPLALAAERKLDERRQRALTRYYLAAGAHGVAVGVHGYPRVPLERMIRWVAHWVARGGSTLSKPTHFQARDGRL